MIKVSIIIPIYNVEQYLERCIESALNQTLKNIEILLINDGSSDRSFEIANSYYIKYPQVIKLINKRNGGLSEARNYGIKEAQGEYLFFLDSDDWLDTDLINQMYTKALEKHLDIVICGFSMINENNLIFSKYGLLNDKAVKKENYILETSEACNKLYKRELFQNIVFPIGKWYEDLAVIPIVLMKAKNVGQIESYGYYYFNRSNSITKSYTNKVVDILYAFDCLIESNIIPLEIINELYLKHLYFSLIRIGYIKDKQQKREILETFYKYTLLNFKIIYQKNNFRNKHLNQCLLVMLFIQRKFYLYEWLINIEILLTSLYKKIKYKYIKLK